MKTEIGVRGFFDFFSFFPTEEAANEARWRSTMGRTAHRRAAGRAAPLHGVPPSEALFAMSPPLFTVSPPRTAL